MGRPSEPHDVRREKALARHGLREQWNAAENARRSVLLGEFLELDPDLSLELCLSALEEPYRPLRERAAQTLTALAGTGRSSGAESVGSGNDEIFTELCYGAMTSGATFNTVSLLFHLLLSWGGRGVFRAFDYFCLHPERQRELVDLARGYTPLERLRLFIPFALAPRHVKRRVAGTLAPLLTLDTPAEDGATWLWEMAASTPIPLDAVRGLSGDYFDAFIKGARLYEYLMGRMASPLPGTTTLHAITALGWFQEEGLPHGFFDLLVVDFPAPFREAVCRVIARAGDGWLAQGRESLLEAAQGPDDSACDVLPLVARVWDSAALAGVVNAMMQRWNGATRQRLWDALSRLPLRSVAGTLKHLPPEFAREAMRGMAQSMVERSPRLALALFRFYSLGFDLEMMGVAASFLEASEAALDASRERLLKEMDPGNSEDAAETKGFFGYLMERPHIRRFRKEPLGSFEGETFVGKSFSHQDFSGLRIKGGNFSGAHFLKMSLSGVTLESVNFNFCTFESCDLAGAKLLNCTFDGAVFRKVDLKGARISGCRFSRSLLYDVSAQGLSMVDSTLSGARITQGLFAEALFLRVRLAGAQISICNFFKSRFVLTRFDRALWQMNDLTDVQCPGGHKPENRLPETTEQALDDALFSAELMESRWFNLLHQALRMDGQRQAFEQYNRRRLEMCMDCLKERQEEFFELIPLLIHDPSLPFPGAPEEASPGGIFGFQVDDDLVALAREHLSAAPREMVSDVSFDGLYSIGSNGSVAQTPGSDIDYWLCLGEEGCAPEALKRLSARLAALESWAENHYHLEIHFFVMEPEAIRGNLFGGSDKESSGSAQGKILKEEFYRTMQMVAGKIPFWCVVPVGMPASLYDSLYVVGSEVHPDLIDLGLVTHIPDGEYFGASIWQLFKSFLSPFKSVMKMALLERTIFGESRERLLCDVLKARWSAGGWGQTGEDPYLLLYETLMAYYLEKGHQTEAGMVRLSFFEKLGGQVLGQERSLFQMRQTVLGRFMSNMGAEGVRFQQMEGAVGLGADDRLGAVAASVNTFMITTYRRLSNHLKVTGKSESKITDRDITILGRRMMVHYADMEGKLMKRDLVSRKRVNYKELSLAFRGSRGGSGSWEMYGGPPPSTLPDGARGTLFKGANHAEALAVQAVFNGYHTRDVLVKMLPNPTEVSLRDVIRLMNVLLELFPQGEEFAIDPGDLLETERVRRAILIVGLDSRGLSGEFCSFTLFYMTSWGAYHMRHFQSDEGYQTAIDALSSARESVGLSFEAGDVQVFVPERIRKRMRGGEATVHV